MDTASSDPYAHRLAGAPHPPKTSMPYPPYEPRHPSEAESLRAPTAHHHHGPQHPHLHHHPYGNPHAGPMYASSSQHQADMHHRHVSRAACLSCRTAKRKCDGVKPVCGPCALRGVKDGYPQEDGGCVYVASKRGGPRFKGVKGAEATKRKLDEREKGGKVKGRNSDELHSQSPPDHSSHHYSSNASTPLDGSNVHSRYHANEPHSNFPSNNGASSLNSLDLARAGVDMLSVSAQGMPSMEESNDAFSFDRERNALTPRSFFRPDSAVGGGLFDDLSATNFDLLQKLSANQASIGVSLANFYSKLEDLPKAGVLAMSNVDEFGSIEVDMPQALLEIETANKSSAAVNSEQQARALLNDFYELVYPACPVMLPSGHLSSLAFHLSEDESSALLAAVSACVALQLPQTEARRIVKGSLLFHDPDDHETKAELLDLEHASREEIAAYHAKSAEKLLLKKVALLARASSFPPNRQKQSKQASSSPTTAEVLLLTSSWSGSSSSLLIPFWPTIIMEPPTVDAPSTTHRRLGIMHRRSTWIRAKASLRLHPGSVTSRNASGHAERTGHATPPPPSCRALVASSPSQLHETCLRTSVSFPTCAVIAAAGRCWCAVLSSYLDHTRVCTISTRTRIDRRTRWLILQLSRAISDEGGR